MQEDREERRGGGIGKNEVCMKMPQWNPLLCVLILKNSTNQPANQLEKNVWAEGKA